LPRIKSTKGALRTKRPFSLLEVFQKILSKSVENFPTYGSIYMREEFLIGCTAEEVKKRWSLRTSLQASVAIPTLTNRHYFKETLFEGDSTNECKNIE